MSEAPTTPEEVALTDRLLAGLKTRLGDSWEALEAPARQAAVRLGRLLRLQLTGQDVSADLLHVKAHLAGLEFEGAVALRDALRETLAEILHEIAEIALALA